MRREGACAKRRRLAPTRGQAHGRMPPAGAYGEAGGPRRGDGGEKRCCCGYADATLCLFMLILPTAAVLLPITASALLHLRLFFALPLYCRCIAVALPLYCRCIAVVLPLYCRCIAVVLPLYCRCAVCRIIYCGYPAHALLCPRCGAGNEAPQAAPWRRCPAL